MAQATTKIPAATITSLAVNSFTHNGDEPRNAGAGSGNTASTSQSILNCWNGFKVPDPAFATDPFAYDSVVVVPHGATEVASGSNFKLALTKLLTLTPGGNAISSTNRVTLMVPPGVYDIGNTGITLNTPGVTIVGCGTSRLLDYGTSAFSSPETVIKCTSTSAVFTVTADHVELRGMTLQGAARGIRINEIGGCANCKFCDLTISATGSYAIAADSTYTVIASYFEQCHSAQAMLYAAAVTAKTVSVSGGASSFGGTGVYRGTAIDCQGGDLSFGATAGSGSARMTRCKSLARSEAIKNYVGEMDDCVIQVTGTDKNAVEVAGLTTFRLCDLAGNGTGYSVSASSAINIDMRLCMLRSDIGPNVTNVVDDGYNVIDTDQVFD